MTEIDGRVALVTGGGSGIGRGLVLAAADEGASVVVADIVEERAREVADEVRANGGTAVPIACDVSSRQGVRQMKVEANDALGPVQILFANAGVTWFDPLAEMTDDAVDWVMQVNVMGAMYCMQAFLPEMIAAREGHVIATASNAGLISGWVPEHAPYSAAKSGTIGLMLNLRIELEQHNVGSTVYCPGGVLGRISESIKFRPDRFGGPDDQPLRMDVEWGRKNVVGFFEPEEVGPMVMDAVKANHPMCVDHANQRPHFMEHFVDHALAAFDRAEQWEQSLEQQRAESPS